MSNEKLISWKRHQGPMHAVLRRYGIGKPDRYDRGVWISEADLSEILARMKLDPTRIEAGGRIFVQGTNIHNHVEANDFIRLFGKG